MYDFSKKSPPKVLGNYELSQETPLGEGGMGTVYLYKEPRLKRKVAIKYLADAPRGREKEWRQRIADEALIPAQISSPYVITIYDCGEINGSSYVVMEYLSNARTLDEELQNHLPEVEDDEEDEDEEEDDQEELTSEEDATNGQTSAEDEVEDAETDRDDRKDYPKPVSEMPIVELLGYFEQTLLALKDLHGQPGRYHRDVKPANLLLYRLDGGATGLKLIDFGFVHKPNSKLTLSGNQILGTIGYSAPEFWCHSPASGVVGDNRSDLYSLGVTFYELFTGQHPYSEVTTMLDAFDYHNVFNKDIKPPSEIRPQIPKKIDAIILKLMAEKAENRYQSADEVLADLAKIRFMSAANDNHRVQLSLSKLHVGVAIVALFLIIVGGLAVLEANQKERQELAKYQFELQQAYAKIQAIEENLLPALPQQSVACRPEKESPKKNTSQKQPRKRSKKKPRKKANKKKPEEIKYRRFFSPSYSIDMSPEKEEPLVDYSLDFLEKTLAQQKNSSKTN